jgi:hypothetical protein
MLSYGGTSYLWHAIAISVRFSKKRMDGDARDWQSPRDNASKTRHSRWFGITAPIAESFGHTREPTQKHLNIFNNSKKLLNTLFGHFTSLFIISYQISHVTLSDPMLNRQATVSIPLFFPQKTSLRRGLEKVYIHRSNSIQMATKEPGPLVSVCTPSGIQSCGCAKNRQTVSCCGSYLLSKISSCRRIRGSRGTCRICHCGRGLVIFRLRWADIGSCVRPKFGDLNHEV